MRPVSPNSNIRRGILVDRGVLLSDDELLRLRTRLLRTRLKAMFPLDELKRLKGERRRCTLTNVLRWVREKLPDDVNAQWARDFVFTQLEELRDEWRAIKVRDVYRDPDEKAPSPTRERQKPGAMRRLPIFAIGSIA